MNAQNQVPVWKSVLYDEISLSNFAWIIFQSKANVFSCFYLLCIYIKISASFLFSKLHTEAVELNLNILNKHSIWIWYG